MCFEYFHVFYLFFSNLNNNEYDERRLPLRTLHRHTHFIRLDYWLDTTILFLFKFKWLR